MYYVLDLSQSGRTAIDWAVIGLVSAAILWNLVQLGRRLHRAGGGKAVWHLQRTVLFWIIGLLNTALLRPADVGSWKNWAGWAFLLLATLDSIALFLKERQSIVTPAPGGEDSEIVERAS
jgi:hypothetical protein